MKRFFGRALANIGDIDKDGINDIAINCNDFNKQIGVIIICFLNKNGSVKSTVEISEGKGGLPTDFTTSDTYGFGISLAGIGDFDKDGVNDILVGSYRPTSGFQGEIFILYLIKNGTVKKYNRIGEGIGGFFGQLDKGDNFGASVCSIGDIDKDGIDDFAVGSFNDNKSGLATGAVWILFLKADGTVKSYKKLDRNSTLLSSLHDDENFGKSATNFGDFDKDGINDIIVGSDRTSDGGYHRGSLRILYLNTDGSIKKVSKISSTSGNFNDSLINSAFFGSAVTSLGDLDGDSIVDITASAISYNSHRGAIWNILLKSDGTCKSIQKITSDTGGFNVKLNSYDEFGIALVSIGDLNSDGIPDVISGSLSDAESGVAAGSPLYSFSQRQTPIYYSNFFVYTKQGYY